MVVVVVFPLPVRRDRTEFNENVPKVLRLHPCWEHFYNSVNLVIIVVVMKFTGGGVVGFTGSHQIAHSCYDLTKPVHSLAPPQTALNNSKQL